jgi:hypothetical protein
MNISPEQARVAVILALQTNGFLQSPLSGALLVWKKQSDEDILKQVKDRLDAKKTKLKVAFPNIVQQFGGVASTNDVLKYLRRIFKDAADADAKIDLERAIGLYGATEDNRQLLAAFLLLFSGLVEGKTDARFSRRDAEGVLTNEVAVMAHVSALAKQSNCGNPEIKKLMKLMEKTSSAIFRTHGRNRTRGLSTKNKTECGSAITHVSKYLKGAGWDEFENRSFGADVAVQEATKVTRENGSLVEDGKMVPLTRLGVVARVFRSKDLAEIRSKAAQSNASLMKELFEECLKQPNAPAWALASMSLIDPDLNAATAIKYSTKLSQMKPKQKNMYGADQGHACNTLMDTVLMLLQTASDPPPKLQKNASLEENKVHAALSLALVPFLRDSVEVEAKQRKELALLLNDESKFKEKIRELLSENKYFDRKTQRVLGELSLKHIRARSQTHESNYEVFLWDFLSKVHFLVWVDTDCEKNLCPEGDCRNIQSNYRKWALILHPDKNIGSSSATADFKQLQACREKMQHQFGTGDKEVYSSHARSSIANSKTSALRTPFQNSPDGEDAAVDSPSLPGRSSLHGDAFWQTMGIFSLFAPFATPLLKIIVGSGLNDAIIGAVELIEAHIDLFSDTLNLESVNWLIKAATSFGDGLKGTEEDEMRKFAMDEKKQWHLLNCLRLRKVGGSDCHYLKAGASIAYTVLTVLVMFWAFKRYMDVLNPLNPWRFLWIIDLASDRLTGIRPVKKMVDVGSRALGRGVAYGSQKLGEGLTGASSSLKRKTEDVEANSRKTRKGVASSGDVEMGPEVRPSTVSEVVNDGPRQIVSGNSHSIIASTEGTDHVPITTRTHFLQTMASNIKSLGQAIGGRGDANAGKSSQGGVIKPQLKQKPKSSTRSDLIFRNFPKFSFAN